MIDRIIDFSLHHRFLVVVLTLVVVGVGVYSLARLPIDAVPDITSVQVQVLTRTVPLGPAEVERMITFPVETAMSGLPEVEEIRSVSRFGLSAVTVVFKDRVNVYFARQLVQERLAEAKESIPEGFGTPEMGPVTTGLGEVYQFVLRGEGYSLMELKEILEWQIAYRLRSVPGVTEVSPEGGFTKQYHVVIDPARLVAYNLSVGEVFEAVERNNAVAGGGYIAHNGEAYLISGEGLVSKPADIADIIVRAGKDGVPIRVRQVAEVKIDAMPRIGAATAEGKGEAVIAMALMLKGANGRIVAEGIKQEVEQIKKALPPGVTIEPFYDRSELVNRVIGTVSKNLIEGGLLVVAVLLLFLGDVRGGLIVASAIPLSMLIAFSGMVQAGISGNLMSLGAIDFGLIVDGAVVMIENFVRRLSGAGSEDRQEIIRKAAHEVARPVVFAVGIIIIVYVPILTLSGVEGKMFRPMALTVIFALVASLVLTVTLMPVLGSLLLRVRGHGHEPAIVRRVREAYLPLLRKTVRRPGLTAGVAAVAFAGSLALVPLMGSEFIPRLDEGDLVLQAWRLPSISLEESIRSTLRIERTLKQFPEVVSVVSRTGTPDVATDVMGMELSDIFVRLRSRETWTTARTKEELIAKMDEALKREAPGAGISFSQPIEMRFNELIAGVKSDVAVKVFGEDLGLLQEKGQEVARALSRVAGSQDVRVEQVAGLPVMRVRVDRDAIARYGINAADVLSAVEAAGAGRVVGSVFEGQRRFDLVVRLRAALSDGQNDFARLPIATPDGRLIPLGQLARVSVEEGPAQVSRESIQRRIVVEANVRGRDLGGFVEEAQRRVETEVRLPAGYYFQWGGQFENLRAARQRLALVVPLSLLLIFVLLYTAFNSVRPALLIYFNIPIAATGGILALFVRGMPFSISAGIGFIALFGVAVLNGVVLVSYINRLRQEGADPEEAALKGAEGRLRPVLMTALVASLGFVPMALSTSAGAEVQRPLATVVIGGLITSTLLTLLVLPALYGWFERRRGT